MVRDVKLPWNRDQLLNVFKSYDKDGDGKLSKDELRQAFKYLGSRWSFYRTTKAFRKADANKDGFINSEELVDLVNYALDCGYKWVSGCSKGVDPVVCARLLVHH